MGKKDGYVCPKCGKPLAERHAKADPERTFWSCTGYPECDWMCQSDPESGKPYMHSCPECGRSLSKRQRRSGDGWYVVCPNAEGHEDKEKHYFSVDPETGGPVLATCPECGRRLSKWPSRSGDGYYCVCSNAEGHKSGKKIYFNGDGTPREPRPEAAGEFKCPDCGQPLKYFRSSKGPRAGQMSFGCFNKEAHPSGKPVFFDDDGTGKPAGLA